MRTKEQLLFYFLLKQLRLHYNDRKFFTNLSILVKNSKITTGQTQLFDKLVAKYYQQLKKTNLTMEELLALPWAVEVIETSKEYTAARVTVKNDIIIVKVPLNRKFINTFENLHDNPFYWNNKDKEYTANLSTTALKILYNILPKYFQEIRYCDQLQNLINDANKIESDLIWQPTYTKINDYYLIVSTNSVLDQLCKDIEFDNKDQTLYKLSKLGIKIDDKITNNDSYLQFVSSPVYTIEISNLDQLASWCKQLGITQILLGKGVHTVFEKTKGFFKRFIEMLDESNIKTRTFHTGYEHDPDQTQLPMLIQYHGDESAKFYGKNAIGKCVFVTNSTPIEVE